VKFKRTVSIITSVAFFAATMMSSVAWSAPPAPAGSGPKITTLNLGDPAPFAGTLFNTQASAKLLIDLEFNLETCRVETDRKLGLLRSELQLNIDLCQASRDALQFRFDETIKIKQGQIQFLEQQMKPSPWYESGEFWFAVGLIGGVLITVGAGYALGQTK
jgi:hypothetical protein